MWQCCKCCHTFHRLMSFKKVLQICIIKVAVKNEVRTSRLIYIYKKLGGKMEHIQKLAIKIHNFCHILIKLVKDSLHIVTSFNKFHEYRTINFYFLLMVLFWICPIFPKTLIYLSAIRWAKYLPSFLKYFSHSDEMLGSLVKSGWDQNRLFSVQIMLFL